MTALTARRTAQIDDTSVKEPSTGNQSPVDDHPSSARGVKRSIVPFRSKVRAAIFTTSASMKHLVKTLRGIAETAKPWKTRSLLRAPKRIISSPIIPRLSRKDSVSSEPHVKGVPNTIQ